MKQNNLKFKNFKVLAPKKLFDVRYEKDGMISPNDPKGFMAFLKRYS